MSYGVIIRHAIKLESVSSRMNDQIFVKDSLTNLNSRVSRSSVLCWQQLVKSMVSGLA